MNIGIDIDATLNNASEYMLAYGQLYDNTFLGNKGIKNIDGYYETEIFNWTEEEYLDYYSKGIDNILKEMDVRPLAKETVDELKSQGHKIYIVTSRSTLHIKQPYEVSKGWLENKGIQYDVLLVDQQRKEETCKKYNIDILMDDKPSTCVNTSNAGIKVLMMDYRFNKDIDTTNTNITRVYSWGQVLYEINRIKEEIKR